MVVGRGATGEEGAREGRATHRGGGDGEGRLKKDGDEKNEEDE